MIFDIENWLCKSNFGTFWHLPTFSKFINFLWVCWFIGKNLSNFVPPAWKLDNPYYHKKDESDDESYYGYYESDEDEYDYYEYNSDEDEIEIDG